MIDCLLSAGVTKAAPPDEAKLRYLADRGDTTAKTLLGELYGHKRGKA